MNRVTEMELMRLLHGELPPDRAAALRARLEREPALAAALARLRATWEGLELPPAAPVPLGFAVRVAARAREERSSAVSWAAAPAWVRGAAAAALALGVLLGAGAGRWTAPEPDRAELPRQTAPQTARQTAPQAAPLTAPQTARQTAPQTVQAHTEPATVTTADDLPDALFDDSLAGSYWSALDEPGTPGLTEETPPSADAGGDAL